jgi:hypothetical protein
VSTVYNSAPKSIPNTELCGLIYNALKTHFNLHPNDYVDTQDLLTETQDSPFYNDTVTTFKKTEETAERLVRYISYTELGTNPQGPQN